MSILGRRKCSCSQSKDVMDRRYRSEKDLDDLALRLDSYSEAIDPYEYKDSEYSVREAYDDINDPVRLRAVIRSVKEDEDMLEDLDDEGVKQTFGFSRTQRKHLLSDLKKRFNDLVRKR